MPADPELSVRSIADISRRLLRPYTVGTDSPYLSEDQRRLSEMTLAERSAWMAEWLHWAQPAGGARARTLAVDGATRGIGERARGSRV